ncbi:hypothetical protein ACAX43_09275 [Paraburkholderia sp. IW21]|uniref:hypothetical protein n=1 Tax=Paraburkholderia sp. IW21 TaxID=3242488 RepID=UPI003520BF32
MKQRKKWRAPQRARHFFQQAGKAFVVFERLNNIRRAASGSRARQAAEKKIPAFRRANDTLFNVSERSAM